MNHWDVYGFSVIRVDKPPLFSKWLKIFNECVYKFILFSLFYWYTNTLRDIDYCGF